MGGLGIAIGESNLSDSESSFDNAKKSFSKLSSTFEFCLQIRHLVGSKGQYHCFNVGLSNELQMTALRVLLDQSIPKMQTSIEVLLLTKDMMGFDRLFLPSMGLNKAPLKSNWNFVCCVEFYLKKNINIFTSNNHCQVHTMNVLICSAWWKIVGIHPSYWAFVL
uniref:uncharacterized protein LOC122583060 isoform X2 n=1 Tax=Erigeron canadensis TaxID=72917 RepID=UPI001CB9409F|nr:uncharacterized protein LOC122583060 isoform X2 [Erigeron canadensis]